MKEVPPQDRIMLTGTRPGCNYQQIRIKTEDIDKHEIFIMDHSRSWHLRLTMPLTQTIYSTLLMWNAACWDVCEDNDDYEIVIFQYDANPPSP